MAEQGTPCSVVLEGGVTSAVLYASLLARLSRRFQFCQLGGTSSGAVAAAAAAAAEHGRLHSGGGDASFKALGDFPARLAQTDLTGRTLLRRLFEPTDKSRPTLEWALRMMDAPPDAGLWTRMGRALVAAAALHATATTLIALLLVGLGGVLLPLLNHAIGCQLDAFLGCAAILASWVGLMLLGVIAAVIALLGVTVWRAFAALRAGHWGLCSGMGSDDALTRVLYRFLQGLSGLPENSPLTFGHLWARPANQPEATEGPRAGVGARWIDLQIITTAVNTQRPVRLPGSPGTNPLKGYFYDPQEWDALFPDEVMAWLAKTAPPEVLAKADGKPLRALPDPALWPVIVAVRLSLSFPILLAAMPMYIAVPRRDRLRGEGDPKLADFEARKVYFSDGGITSNCPLDLFDAPLPACPTFGVNLFRLPDGRKPRIVRSDQLDPELEAANVADAAGWTCPLPFLVRIVLTMLDWRDSLQRSLPGQRERIVHVGLARDLGGLKLTMPPDKILTLAQVGQDAACQLEADFLGLDPGGGANAWERHRWVRTRTTLCAVHTYLSTLVNRLSIGEPDYLRMLRLNTSERPPFESDAQRAQALTLVEGLQDLMQRVGPPPADQGPPVATASPQLKITPPT